MPKEPRVTTAPRPSPIEAIHPQHASAPQAQGAQRNAAIWNEADDQILIGARASGLNWQPIATRHFPNKTANACRKRHERLMERRNHSDWDSRKLDALATGYMECRKEMWSILAARIGERWALVEEKCMEKGLKNLQAMARAANKRNVAMERAHHGGNEEDHHEGDSGIGVSDEDAEMEVGEGSSRILASSSLQMSPPVHPSNDHSERHLPPTLPLYEPPVSVRARGSSHSRPQPQQSMGGPSTNAEGGNNAPDEQSPRGVSIRSMLSNQEGMSGT